MADKTFRLEIIAPDRIFYSNDIYMVEYNTVEGEVGIYADHIPMTQIIAPGRLIITERNEEKQAALLSGFVEITPEKMTILAEAVEWPQNIDVNRAKKLRPARRGDFLPNREELISVAQNSPLREQLPDWMWRGNNFIVRQTKTKNTIFSYL